MCARSWHILLSALGILLMLPGCIIFEIEKELAAANQKMKGSNERLDKIEVTLEQLAQTNELLDEFEPQLRELDKLVMLEKLETLHSIDQSLKRLDEHLASLRKTIRNIDSTIPFLTISSDEEDEGIQEAAVEAEAEGAAEPD